MHWEPSGHVRQANMFMLRNLNAGVFRRVEK